jgi:GDP/UDP-N,N'-diacetylbacillosamine 2-epimerase (hydrolysing)
MLGFLPTLLLSGSSFMPCHPSRFYHQQGEGMSVKRKICVVTGTRAEYGLLRRLIALIKSSPDLELQLIVTGTHLSKKYGETYKDIELDGFHIDRRIDLVLVSDTPVGLAKSTSLGLMGFADAFDSLSPDLLLVLGDRFEILSAVIAAMFARIPIAHLHGGELTEGLIDEAIRHSVTKFSHLHFVATEEYQNRVIQLGENPKHVFNVGGLGVDAIKNIKLLEKSELEASLGLKFKEKNLLITFHPVTLEKNTSLEQMNELLNALSEFKDTCLIFTMHNADTDSHAIFKAIEEFVSLNPNAHVFTSLGRLRYLSCIAQVDAVVGNSSSGLAEIPTFKKPTINIGDRQKGRVQCKSVINCNPTKNDIKRAIENSYSKEFRHKMSDVVNPYGDGGSSERILNILRTANLDGLIKKAFYDLSSKCE